MSVLCCRVSDFLIRLHQRHHPAGGEQPLALLGGDERVWAVSSQARACGVLVNMTPRQAYMRCPDLALRPLDSAVAEAEQVAFNGVLRALGLPVESLGWGAAYVDLHLLATEKDKVKPFCMEIGRTLRQELGEAMQPSLGWDSGKFTARAAAIRADPGMVKLIEKANEVGFLRPLPIALLPLSPQALQTLHWLGIRTLGQFAQLPELAVWQRFGQAGKLARRWAQGRDSRPVQATVGQSPASASVSFEPPEVLLGAVTTAIMAQLQPILADLVESLAGIRHLRLQVHCLDRSTTTLDLTFVEAVDQADRIRTVLHEKLAATTWTAEIEEVTLWVLATGELPIRQAMLFPELEPGEQRPLAELAASRQGRYGRVFYQGAVVDPHHPAHERRTQRHILALGEGPL